MDFIYSEIDYFGGYKFQQVAVDAEVLHIGLPGSVDVHFAMVRSRHRDTRDVGLFMTSHDVINCITS